MIIEIINWVQENDALLWWLAIVSVIMFISTLIAVPLVVVRIPDDYFADHKRKKSLLADVPPLAKIILVVVKNIVGFIFVIAGILMLVLPGQGILTILIGLTLLSFPGKYQLSRWLISRRKVHSSVNWIRKRSGRAPLKIKKHPQTNERKKT